MASDTNPVMVDTCVLLDVATQDPKWFEWSSGALAEAADRGRLIINAVIYAELSVGFARIETLQQILDPQVFDYRPIPREAAFLAGKAFARYRGQSGAKTRPLPDFFIGAHASIESLPLLTRDVKRFTTYFPQLQIIRPS
ncbi:MAG: type II toxin-antitoxin system VapC family toxin [Phycisphaeraceae bacterium]